MERALHGKGFKSWAMKKGNWCRDWPKWHQKAFMLKIWRKSPVESKDGTNETWPIGMNIFASGAASLW